MAESLWHKSVEADPGRRTMFEVLVLQSLWVLIMCAFGMRPREQALTLRSNIIDYMDVHGKQSDEAKKYRRETTYQAIP